MNLEWLHFESTKSWRFFFIIGEAVVNTYFTTCLGESYFLVKEYNKHDEEINEKTFFNTLYTTYVNTKDHGLRNNWFKKKGSRYLIGTYVKY